MIITGQNWYFRFTEYDTKISYSNRFEEVCKNKEGNPFNATVQYHQDQIP